MEHWTRCIDVGNSIDVVYLDFLKVFDKVPYRRLLAISLKLMALVAKYFAGSMLSFQTGDKK